MRDIFAKTTLDDSYKDGILLLNTKLEGNLENTEINVESLKAMDYSQLKGEDINYHATVKWVD